MRSAALHLASWQALPLQECSLAESPRYAHGRWMWLDINNHVLYRLNQTDPFQPEAGNLYTLNLPDEIGCVLPTPNSHTLVALGRQGGWRIEDNTCTLKLPAPFDQTLHRFNDGRADAAGRRGVYVSVMLFGGYQETGPNWAGSPFHRDNNVNGIDGLWIEVPTYLNARRLLQSA